MSVGDILNTKQLLLFSVFFLFIYFPPHFIAQGLQGVLFLIFFAFELIRFCCN